MLERLDFLVVYVGSAAMAAFIAVCLSSPQAGTYVCQKSGANGAERCEVVATLAATALEAEEMLPATLTPDLQSQEPAATASTD